MRLSFESYATDPMLAGPVLGRDSYLPMRTAIKAALAEPMDAIERAVFDRLAGGREPPAKRVPEVWVKAGRASGKTQCMSATAVYLGTCCDWPCDPGQVPVVLLLAADREQATVAFRYVLGTLESSPILSAQIESATKDRIVLRSGVEIQVATSDYRAVRGRSIVAAICDEIAFWPTTIESANPDTEVLTALRPGLARFRDSLLMVISTPYAQQGALYEADRRYYGENDARVLFLSGTTRDFNSAFPEEVVADALVCDPAAAAAEYLCQYRTDVAAFIDVPLVDSLTRSEPRELPRRTIVEQDGTPIQYVAGIDPSGGRGDATACAVAHWHADKVVVDACRRWPAPHDPKAVAIQVAEFLAGYGLHSATGDHYGAELTRSIYTDAGVALIYSEPAKSDVFLRLLPLMTTGKVELPPDPVLRMELLGLERRTGHNGKDRVDHRPGAHDDLANAVALAAVAAARGAQSVSADDIFVVPTEFFDQHLDPSLGHKTGGFFSDY